MQQNRARERHTGLWGCIRMPRKRGPHLDKLFILIWAERCLSNLGQAKHFIHPALLNSPAQHSPKGSYCSNLDREVLVADSSYRSSDCCRHGPKLGQAVAVMPR